ncbi:MAG: PilZ domain-containing protein [Pseudomonadota bacterium]
MKNTKTFGLRRAANASDASRPSAMIGFPNTSDPRRQSERESLWCICYIHAAEFGQDEVREAVLLDLSDTGARVRCRSRAKFPEQVRLRAPRLGLDLKARRVWQNGFDTGIAFDV